MKSLHRGSGIANRCCDFLPDELDQLRAKKLRRFALLHRHRKRPWLNFNTTGQEIDQSALAAVKERAWLAKPRTRTTPIA